MYERKVLGLDRGIFWLIVCLSIGVLANVLIAVVFEEPATGGDGPVPVEGGDGAVEWDEDSDYPEAGDSCSRLGMTTTNPLGERLICRRF